ncbi:efflux RND transporter periplasmic adaptor subunit [Rhodoferax sp.]|uniref:efflux RND transporter periplasmic adaptor subunit n=1 Tax=Rhodoferax sp. TaxID=50421 RepID=UPI00284733C5|nr:efflux RND transporter periplasmic adaptor subunit [Rhodoferax sp.]MDR3367537.1 efflux RND transporter periplasmic adaptor subunit [Rhodoferax sp.]
MTFTPKLTRPRLLTVAAIVLLLAGGAWLLKSRAAPAAAVAPTTNAGLSVSAVQPQQAIWGRSLQLSGGLFAWQTATIASEEAGLRLTEVLVDVGSVVKRGQLLARLTDNTILADLRAQDAAVAQARAKLTQAKAEADRSRAVKDSGALSEQQVTSYVIAEQTAQASLDSAIATLEAQRIKLTHTRILAVDDGIISSRSATLGNVVASGTELFQLVRQRRVEWRAEITGKQLSALKPGQTAKITLPDGQQVSGRLRLIGPTLDSNTRNGLAYIDLPIGSAARPGMYVRGEIDTGQALALTVPSSAVVQRDGNSYVFEKDGATKVAQRQVQTGRRQGDLVEITSGITAQAQLVRSGGAFLKDGDPVQWTRASDSANTKANKAAP